MTKRSKTVVSTGTPPVCVEVEFRRLGNAALAALASDNVSPVSWLPMESCNDPGLISDGVHLSAK